MKSRREFLKLLLPIAGAGALLITSEASARGGKRIRFSGRGLNNNSSYAGPTLSKSELKSCLEKQNSINASLDKLDKEEHHLNEQEPLVNQYSQESVDNFNSLAAQYNSNGKKVNSKIDSFNSSCGNRAYYESDMKSAKRELGMK